MSCQWRSAAGLGYKIWLERDEEGTASGGLTMEVSVDPLDPIDRSLVCGARLKKMFERVGQMDLEVLTGALAMLHCSEKEAPEWYHEFKRCPVETKMVSVRYSSHMRTPGWRKLKSRRDGRYDRSSTQRMPR